MRRTEKRWNLSLAEVWLTLGELGGAAGGLQTVFLALLHSGVAGQQASGLQDGAVLLVDQEQSAGNAVADGAGLAGDAAAGDGGDDVHLAQLLGGDQGLADQQLQGLQTEVIVDVTAVDGDGAGAVLEQMDAGHGGLPAAGAIEIRLLALIHDLNPPLTRRPRPGASGQRARARRRGRCAGESGSPW